MKTIIAVLLLSMVLHAKYPVLGYDVSNDAIVCDDRYAWTILKDGWAVKLEWFNPKLKKIERLKCKDYNTFNEIYLKPKKIGKD